MGILRSKLAQWLRELSGAERVSTTATKRRAPRCEALEDRRVFAGLADLAPPVAAPQAVGDSPFVAALYESILQRPADASGLAFFSNQLAIGASPADVVFRLWHSEEHFGLEVDQYYQQYLGRAADAAGRQFWVAGLVSGLTEEVVQTSLLSSVEYQQLNPLVPSFVTAIYDDVLERPADTDGQLYWSNQLQTSASSVSQMINSFIGSTEAHKLWVGTLYSDLLERQPDSTGESAWVDLLDQGVVDYGFIAQTFLASTEYVTSHPLT